MFDLPIRWACSIIIEYAYKHIRFGEQLKESSIKKLIFQKHKFTRLESHDWESLATAIG